MGYLSRMSLTSCAVLISTAIVGAQTFRGSLTGTVTDSSGATIPNASVVLTNPATNEVLSNLNKAAWASPVPAGTTICYCYGNERRNSVVGPGFGSVDLSMFKRTAITERVSTELRAEIFNVANQANFLNPSGSLTSSSFGILNSTRNGSLAPGLGAGEPRNMQFALKISF